MSTAAASKTPRREAATRTASSSPGAANRTPAKSSAPTTNGAGVTRTRSVRSGTNGAPVSARAAVRKPATASNLSNNASQADGSDEDAREEQAAYLQDLKERLEKAESEVDERQKQVKVLNAQLDEALQEQAKLEDRAHEEEEKVESLENLRRELTRQHRELEGIYEAERVQAMKEKENTQAREEELQETIQRLKETMASKNLQPEGEEDHVSRACESAFTLPKYPSVCADRAQQTSATTSLAPTHHKTSKEPHPLRRRLPSTAATRAATRSLSTRRTRSSRVCGWSSPNTRSKCWR